jgi:hypothetical protein
VDDELSEVEKLQRDYLGLAAAVAAFLEDCSNPTTRSELAMRLARLKWENKGYNYWKGEIELMVRAVRIETPRDGWVRCPSCGYDWPPTSNWNSLTKCPSCRRQELEVITVTHSPDSGWAVTPTFLATVGLSLGLLFLFLLLKLVGVIQ